MLKDAVKLRNNTFKENVKEHKAKREKRKTLLQKIKSKNNIEDPEAYNDQLTDIEIRNSNEISRINTEIVAGENISSDNYSDESFDIDNEVDENYTKK